MSKVMINVPLTKYLQEMARGFGECFITKTNGGQTWFSSDAPGNLEGADWKEYKNEIDFSDSDFYTRLPKYVAEHLDIKNGCYKPLKDVIKEIKKKEKEIC